MGSCSGGRGRVGVGGCCGSVGSGGSGSLSSGGMWTARAKRVSHRVDGDGRRSVGGIDYRSGGGGCDGSGSGGSGGRGSPPPPPVASTPLGGGSPSARPAPPPLAIFSRFDFWFCDPLGSLSAPSPGGRTVGAYPARRTQPCLRAERPVPPPPRSCCAGLSRGTVSTANDFLDGGAAWRCLAHEDDAAAPPARVVWPDAPRRGRRGDGGDAGGTLS